MGVFTFTQQGKPMKNMTPFTPEQRSAVLAGLRQLQVSREQGGLSGDIDSVLTDGGTLEGLSNQEINDLCKEINCGGIFQSSAE